MKKVLLAITLSLLLCTACGEKAVLNVPDVVEPTIEEIKKSNIEVAKNSFINIKKTAELYYMERQLNLEYIPTDIKIDFSDSSTIPEDFVFSGIMPESGIIYISQNGEVTLSNIIINSLICNFHENNEVICK